MLEVVERWKRAKIGHQSEAIQSASERFSRSTAQSTRSNHCHQNRDSDSDGCDGRYSGHRSWQGYSACRRQFHLANSRDTYSNYGYSPGSRASHCPPPLPDNRDAHPYYGWLETTYGKQAMPPPPPCKNARQPLPLW